MNIQSASQLGKKESKGIKRQDWSDYMTIQGAEPGKPEFTPSWQFPDHVHPHLNPEDLDANDWIVEGYSEEKEPIASYWFVVFSWTKLTGGQGQSSRALLLTGDGEFHPSLVADYYMKENSLKEFVLENWIRLTKAQYDGEVAHADASRDKAALATPEVPASP